MCRITQNKNRISLTLINICNCECQRKRNYNSPVCNLATHRAKKNVQKQQLEVKTDEYEVLSNMLRHPKMFFWGKCTTMEDFF